MAAIVQERTPTFNRCDLESRLAYRKQELAYGGLKPETMRRLEELGKELDGGSKPRRQTRAHTRPIAGTPLIREYQGIEHGVTARDDDFEYQRRPEEPLSAIAPTITGTPWRGAVFFGLRGGRRA